MAVVRALVVEREPEHAAVEAVAEPAEVVEQALELLRWAREPAPASTASWAGVYIEKIPAIFWFSQNL